MIYFSEIKNKKVYTEDNLYIGTVDDLVFCFTKTPYITKILVKPSKQLGQEKLFIPVHHLLRINNVIIVAKNYETSQLQENELFVVRNLVDKQIIDIEGNKIVRVNDVLLQKKNGTTILITGVDVGILGVLRWFGAENIMEKFLAFFGQQIASRFVAWSNIQPLELARGKVVLNIKQDKLQKLHPADLADYLESTNVKNIIKIIDLLDREFAIKVIAELNLNYQISLLKNLGFEKTIKIISLIDADEAVDILTQFSLRRRDAILKGVTKEKRHELESLLRFGTTSIGHYLNPDAVIVKSADTVISVTEKIKKEYADISFLLYVYIINNQDQLVGVFNLHELILQRPETPVYKFMTQNVIVVHLHTSLHTVFRKLIKYKLSALPVVQTDKKIIGIVTMDDVGEIFLDKF